jgi:class 3 adenylate cyclase/pSer/pThr/pTyr-binding forkhead associated (FHA) protein
MGLRNHMAEPESGTLVTKLLELAQVDASYLKELDKLRRAITVMFTDIKGSTAYFEKYGDGAGLLMVHQCNDALRRVVESRKGRVIKTIGDGMMAAFDECLHSVEAALEMQTSLAQLNSLRPESDRVAVRIGLHYDTGIMRSNDIFGDVVNVASRVENVAAPGQIVISDTLYEQVRQSGFVVRELGRFLLKGKTHERTLYEVAWTVRKEAQVSREQAAVPNAKPGFKLQLIGKDGSIGAEYPIQESLTIGRTEGDIRFTADANLAPRNARVFIEEGQLFVEDLSDGTESIFVKLSGGYTLQNDDIVLIGQQVFRFREVAGAMSAVTRIGATLSDITDALQQPVATLLRLDEKGRGAGSFPLSATEVQFGRTRGAYVFQDDNLMSRLHARILQRGEDFVLEDLGSRNGTLVKVRGKTPLPLGAAVLVGSELLRVAS